MIGSRTPPFPAISRTNETVATCPYSDTPLSAGTCVVRLTGVSSLVSRVGHLPEHRPRGFLHHIRQGDSRGSLTQILILLEDTITSGLIEKPANNLKKGGPFDLSGHAGNRGSDAAAVAVRSPVGQRHVYSVRATAADIRGNDG